MHASKIIKIIIQCIKETSGCVWNLEIIGTQLGKYTLWDCMMINSLDEKVLLTYLHSGFCFRET